MEESGLSYNYDINTVKRFMIFSFFLILKLNSTRGLIVQLFDGFN